MKRFSIVFFVVLAFLLVFSGCATRQPLPDYMAKDLNPQVSSGSLMTKADNFVVVMDASGSMADRCAKEVKLNLAKEFANGMNETIPNVSFVSGLRTFGGSKCPFAKKTQLIEGLGKYCPVEYKAAIDSVKRAGGSSPLDKALVAAGADIESLSGNTALIVISDGQEMGDGAVGVAQNLREQFGDRLCIYTVLVGEDSAGRDLLKNVAAAGNCGFAVEAAAIDTPDAMAAYVLDVLFTQAVDSDGDGVFDADDQCPDTEYGVAVDAVGCPLDSDRDGVLDSEDQCPGTPLGAEVNEFGCWVCKDVQFAVNSAEIREVDMAGLDAAVMCLKRHAQMNVEVQGHTDNTGSAKYNQALSERRANAVVDYFVGQGIARERLSAKGYGFSMPTADNDTVAGRAMNRRVQLQPVD